MNRSRSSRLGVEQLESRTLLTAGSLKVAYGITNSVENYSNEVATLYQQMLHRTPDQGGLNTWVNSMQFGQPLEAVEAAITSSDEYFAGHGSTNSGYLQGLYTDILGRGADAGGSAHWSGDLAAGATRGSVSAAFSSSTEKLAAVIAADYVNVLGRNPEAGGVDGWMAKTKFNAGGSRNELLALFVGSNEYYQKNGNNDRDFINAAYQTILHRAPSGGGSFSGGGTGNVQGAGQGPSETDFWAGVAQDTPTFAQG